MCWRATQIIPVPFISTSTPSRPGRIPSTRCLPPTGWLITRLPPDIAIVGGRTIASLLRASDQDRLADGTVGWWFYLNFTASPVRYVP